MHVLGKGGIYMNADKINAQMESYVSANEMAGGVLIVRKYGAVVFKGKWGLMDVGRQLPVEYGTIFRQASLSKPLTAVAIMMLADKGLVGLDDEIDKYIPEFKNLCVAADQRYATGNSDPAQFPKLLAAFDPVLVKTETARCMVTVRDLLTHSSGLEQGIAGLLAGMKLEGWQEDTLETRARKWARIPLDFQPGTATGYSPTAGMDTLARVVEVASGRPFSSFMREALFSPLGMKDTSYHPDAAQAGRIPPLYKTVDGRHVDVSGTDEDIDAIGKIGPRYDSGSAGLYATAEDYDRFAQMLYHGGELDGRRYLRAETAQSMGQEGAKRHLQFQPGLVWGLGMIVRQNPEAAGSYATQGTYGWSGAFGTHFFISPKDGLSVVFMMNRADIGGASSYISAKVEELVFGD